MARKRRPTVSHSRSQTSPEPQNRLLISRHGIDEYRNPDAPLASVRVLLSPTDGEELNPRVAGELAGPSPATRDSVVSEFDEFRQGCRENPDNVAFVYFAGHGIQLNKRGAVVLFHDFGVMGKGNKLYGAIDVAGCRDAMDESGNAHHQIWFSDACRQLPDIARKFESLSGAYKADEGIGQVDASPLFLASSARESAFAAVGGTTIFAMRCSRRFAEMRRSAPQMTAATGTSRPPR